MADKSSKRILICDDDEGIIDVTRLVLEDQGYQVEVCNQSDMILELAKTFQPQLILMDLWMPGMGGEEITRRLKKDPATQGIPVIIVSANKDTIKVAESVGAEGFLCKPFDINELEAIAEQYVV